jgi:hypothetical protein
MKKPKSPASPATNNIIIESDYKRRLGRLHSDDNIVRHSVIEIDRRDSPLSSQLLGKIALGPEFEAEITKAIAEFVFTDTYDPYANSLGRWRQLVLANRSGDAHVGESVEHDDEVQVTSNALRVPRLMTMLRSYFDFSYVKSVRIFEVKTGGFIVPHRDYIEFTHGFSRIHLPVVTANGAVTVEGNTAFRMRAGEAWFLDSRIPHTAGNFAPTARYHVAVDCDQKLPLADLFHRPLAAADKVAIIERKPLSMSLQQIAEGVAAILTPLNVKSLLIALTETLFVSNLGCAEVHDVLKMAAAINGDALVIKKAADLRELLIGVDAD